jgi:small ligand-binding sensory domain FIST
MLDHQEFYRGLRSVLGERAPVIGGSAIGIITAEELSYQGYPSGVAVLQSDSLRHKVAVAGGLDRDEYETGKKLAGRLRGGGQEKLFLLFYDSVKVSPTETTPPVMNASPPLIKGVESAMKSAVPIIGAGVVGDYQFRPTKQFCGDHVADQSAVGVLLSGGFEPYFRTIHGCTPKDGIYHTITRMKGPVVFELDGKPIVQVIDQIYGNPSWQSQIPVRRLSLGINHGERYGQFREADYVNRLIAGVLPSKDGIVLFEPDLHEGMEVQFMLRDSDKIIDSARKNTLDLFNLIRADGRRPAFGLYIDCAGRTADMSETLTEEAAEVQKVFREGRVPLLGFYSGVEIAPFLGQSRGLDWTGVLLILAES